MEQKGARLVIRNGLAPLVGWLIANALCANLNCSSLPGRVLAAFHDPEFGALSLYMIAIANEGHGG